MKKNLKEAMVVICFFVVLAISAGVQQRALKMLPDYDFDFSQLDSNNVEIREVYMPEGNFKVFFSGNRANHIDESPTEEILTYIPGSEPPEVIYIGDDGIVKTARYTPERGWELVEQIEIRMK